MSYGLQVTSENGDIQLDTTRTGDQGLTVIASGTSATPFSSYSVPVGTTPILMASVSPSNGSYMFVGFDGTTFKDFNAVTGAITDKSDTNWIICQRTNDLDTGNKSGDYGLQVFNADGDEQFDSRYYNGQGGLGVLGYFPRLSINSGGDGYLFNSGGSTNHRVTSNVSHYVTMTQPGAGGFSDYVAGVGGPSFTGFFVANNFNNKTGTNTNEFTGSTSAAAGEVYNGYYPYRIRQTPKTPGSFQYFNNFSDTLYGEKF